MSQARRGPVLLIVGVGVAGVLAVCLCLVLAGSYFVIGQSVGPGAPPPQPTGSPAQEAERAVFTPPLDRFMTQMSNRAPASAFINLSPQGQTALPREILALELNGTSWAKYDGYEETVVERVNIPTSDSGPATANVSGQMRYRGGEVGRFEAVLHQTNGRWGITSLDITVSTAKIQRTAPPTSPPR